MYTILTYLIAFRTYINHSTTNFASIFKGLAHHHQQYIQPDAIQGILRTLADSEEPASAFYVSFILPHWSTDHR